MSLWRHRYNIWQALYPLTLMTFQLACSDDFGRPRVELGCTSDQEDCYVPAIGIGAPRSSGSGGTAGTGDDGPTGAAGATGVDPPPVVGSLQGRVSLFEGEDFTIRQAFPGLIRLETQRADGAFSVDWAGSDPFELQSSSEIQWVSAAPIGGADAMKTLYRVPGNTAVLELTMVRQSTLELIAGVLFRPQAIEPNVAHLLLRFSESGVRVDSPNAGFSAYRELGGWSDDLSETTRDGLALLGNIPIIGPQSVDVTFSGFLSGQFPARLEPGAITVISVDFIQ